MRALWIVLIGLAIWWLVRGARRGSRAPVARPPGSAPTPLVAMVRCAHCGVHLPAADAIRADALAQTPAWAYCSATHRNAGPMRPAPD